VLFTSRNTRPVKELFSPSELTALEGYENTAGIRPNHPFVNEENFPPQVTLTGIWRINATSLLLLTQNEIQDHMVSSNSASYGRFGYYEFFRFDLITRKAESLFTIDYHQPVCQLNWWSYCYQSFVVVVNVMPNPTYKLLAVTLGADHSISILHYSQSPQCMILAQQQRVYPYTGDLFLLDQSLHVIPIDTTTNSPVNDWSTLSRVRPYKRESDKIGVK